MESDESEDDEEMTAFAAEEDDDDPFGLGADSDADEDGSDGDRAEGESASDLNGDGPDSEEPPRGESRAATPADSAGKYVPPAIRAAKAAAAAKAAGLSESEAKSAADADAARRQVRGLMNRMGESNVASIASEIAALSSRLPRRAVGDAATDEIVKALTEGPRASEQYAAALAAFVAGVSGELGPEMAARFGTAIVSELSSARSETRARAASNLCATLSRLHVCGLFPSRVCYGLLTCLSEKLSELDATLMLGVLRAAGPRLRSEDPAGMRDFILALQSRVARLRDDAGEGGGLTRRARLMLDMVIDLKNNKRQVGAGAGGAGGAEGGDQWGFPAALSKWLRSSAAVGDAAVALRALTYERLVDTSAHRGQWWLPEAAGTQAWFAARAAQGAMDDRARRAGGARATEGAELLEKAKAMRMNTEARRAIFCVIMGAEDFADALDSLLRLPLADKQDREVPRVLLECCLQERAYNPYYETLASKLCERMPKRHRLTLQLCVWDQIREMAPESDAAREHAAEEHAESAKMSVRRVANLARFAAGCLVSGAVAPAALKVVNFGGEDASPRAKLFRRLLLQAILSAPPSKRGAVHAIFQTVAETGLGRGGEMGALRASLANALGARGTLEGLGKGGEDVVGSAAYVAKRAEEARNILAGALA